jgi:hypothetical protein
MYMSLREVPDEIVERHGNLFESCRLLRYARNDILLFERFKGLSL